MAVKASDRVKFYKNKNGATVGSCDRKVFEVEGLYFKDIDGSGEFKYFDDWRNSPTKRAQSYVKVLSTDEKIGLLFASDWRMGLGVIEEFANTVRKECDATGIKKGYMYMADVLTDPRWQRSYGTFGEDPRLIRDIIECFNKNAEQARERSEKLRKFFSDRLNIVEEFEDADIAM